MTYKMPLMDRIVGREFKQYRKTAPAYAIQMYEDFDVETLEGVMHGSAGDYLCRGSAGEYWPVKQSIFEATYEEVPAA